MIIKIRVIPNSKIESVRQTGEAEYKVKVIEKALEGKANTAVVDMLASYFKVRKTDVWIINGLRSREKVVEISI